MYKISDFIAAFSQDVRGQHVFDLIHAAIKKPRLSNELTTLEIELKAVPEYQAYIKDHEANIDKYGREPDERDRNRGIRKVIDTKCSLENLAAYDELEKSLQSVEIDRAIKKIPISHFDDQEVSGSLMRLIYPFVDNEK